MTDVVIVHRYPAATALTHSVGGHGIAVLHALIQRSSRRQGRLEASASLREVCVDVPASKDTVSRRIVQLERLGVVKRMPHCGGLFTSNTYVLHLEGHGVELVA